MLGSSSISKTTVRGLFSDIDSVHGAYCSDDFFQDGMRLLAEKNGVLGLYIVRTGGNLELSSTSVPVNAIDGCKLKTIIGSDNPVIIDSYKNVHFNISGWESIPLTKFNSLLGAVERNLVQDYFFLGGEGESGNSLYIKINHDSNAYYVSYNIGSAVCSVLTDAGLMQHLDEIEKMESGTACFNMKLDFSDAWDMTMRLYEGSVQINADFCRDFIAPENSWKNHILGFVGFAASTDSVKVESLTKFLGLTAWQIEQIVSGTQTGWVDLDFSEEITAKISNAGGVAKIFVTDTYKFDCGDSCIILNDGSLLSVGNSDVAGDDTGSGWALTIEGSQIHSGRLLTAADVAEAKIISHAKLATCAYYIIAGQCFFRGREYISQKGGPGVMQYHSNEWMCVRTGRNFDISGQHQVKTAAVRAATGVDDLAPMASTVVSGNVQAYNSVGDTPIADDVTALQTAANSL